MVHRGRVTKLRIFCLQHFLAKKNNGRRPKLSGVWGPVMCSCRKYLIISVWPNKRALEIFFINNFLISYMVQRIKPGFCSNKLRHCAYICNIQSTQFKKKKTCYVKTKRILQPYYIKNSNYCK